MKDQRSPYKMSAEAVAAIDEWRRKNADLPSRSEANRRLVELGLKAKVMKRKVTTAAEREAEKAFKKVETKTVTSEHEKAKKSFDENRERLKAERIAREAGLKAKK